MTTDADRLRIILPVLHEAEITTELSWETAYEERPSMWLLDYPDGYHDDADEPGEEWKRSSQPMDDRTHPIASILTDDQAITYAIGAMVESLMKGRLYVRLELVGKESLLECAIRTCREANILPRESKL